MAYVYYHYKKGIIHHPQYSNHIDLAMSFILFDAILRPVHAIKQPRISAHIPNAKFSSFV